MCVTYSKVDEERINMEQKSKCLLYPVVVLIDNIERRIGEEIYISSKCKNDHSSMCPHEASYNRQQVTHE